MKLLGNNFSPNSNKVRFAANAMGIAYEFQAVDLSKGEQRQEPFLQINPVGRIPALVDGDFTIFESNSIMRYLAEKINSPLYPADLKKRSLVSQWLDFESIHVSAMAMSKVFFNTVVYKLVQVEKNETLLREGRQLLGNFLKIIEAQLEKGAYICGDELTLADLNLLAILDPCESTGFDLGVFPNLMAWRTNLQEQKFYRTVFPETYTGFLEAVMQKKN